MTKPTCRRHFVIRQEPRSTATIIIPLILGPYSRAGACLPGQFVHVQMPSSDIIFRRALSIAGVSPDRRRGRVDFPDAWAWNAPAGDASQRRSPESCSARSASRLRRRARGEGADGRGGDRISAADVSRRTHDHGPAMTPDQIHFFYGGRTQTRYSGPGPHSSSSA